jgi:hypothetical protein
MLVGLPAAGKAKAVNVATGLAPEDSERLDLVSNSAICQFCLAAIASHVRDRLLR